MQNTTGMGRRIRALRQKHGLTQAALAQRLRISPSYLNLVEHDRRPLTAALLIHFARELDLDLRTFDQTQDAHLTAELVEAFGDPLFEGAGPPEDEIRGLATESPDLARAVLRLHHAYENMRTSAQTLAAQVLDREDLPGIERTVLWSEQVTDFLQRHTNHFPQLEAEAERVWRDGKLEGEDLAGALTSYLENRHKVTVVVAKVGAIGGAMRRYDPESRTLYLSEVLRRGSRNFQIAYQIGRLECPEIMDELVRNSTLTSDDARVLGRVTLANYFAAAVLMPYAEFLSGARDVRYDLDLLQHRFRVNFEQVCHRLCTLQRPGAAGVPFYMVRVDLAGNISKKFSANSARFPRFGGLCPLRNVHAAFMLPNVLRVQLSRLPDGATFFSMARTIRRHRGGYHTPEILYAIELGCEIEHARELVYSDGFDLEHPAGVIPAGVTCRVCERLDCRARAFPAAQVPLTVDENVRGASFYTPVDP